MRLALLCHAATAATRAARFPADEGLDARSLTRRPRLPRHDRAIAGPEKRAVETASALGLDAVIDPALRDLSCGRWVGQTLEAVAAAEPAAVEAWFADPNAASHGGESVLALLARTSAWLDAQADASGSILAVTHAAVIRAVIVRVLGAAPMSFWRIDVAPLTLVTLAGRGSHWRLQALEPARARAATIPRDRA